MPVRALRSDNTSEQTAQVADERPLRLTGEDADCRPVPVHAKAGDGSASAVFQLASQQVSSTGGAVMIRPTNVFFPGTKLSLSDDAAVQYAFIKIAKTSGTTTASVSLAGWVSWTMDEA